MLILSGILIPALNIHCRKEGTRAPSLNNCRFYSMNTIARANVASGDVPVAAAQHLLTFRGWILGRNPSKIFRVILLAIHSHLYSFALRFLFLQTHTTTYSLYSSVTVHGKGEGGKPDRKPYPLPYGLRNPYRNLMSENFQDYAQKPQRNCTFMNSASVFHENRL
jgi:hypothetical protein